MPTQQQNSGSSIGLLVNCSIAHALWSYAIKSFMIQWVLPKTIVDLLFGRRNWFRKHSSDIRNLVPLFLM